ncbi:MAG TPA: glycoside hydrolase family 16 protein [Prolixibacteraceae bacterium]|nr:glycoside hydrolase family 16 protein [Prolixibacteraceae bacterium]
MKSKWFFITNGTILALIAIMLLITCTNRSKDKEPERFRLVWSDEFDTDGLPDPALWSYDTVGNAWGWGNHELQYYTVEREANARVSEGSLKITADKEPYEGAEYTSARLITKGKGDWLYGRFEIRAKLPEGRGLWPAIWMLPTDWKYGGWPRSGEIDIMENVGYDPFAIVASVHTERYNHAIQTQRNNTMQVADNRETFHVYALEWDSVSIHAFVDDSLYFTFAKEADDPAVWPFDQPFHLLLNVAVGGDWGGLMGVNDSIFPVSMEVDYVRVYQALHP